MYPVGYDVNSPAFFSPAGDRYKPEFIGNVLPNGEIELIENGAIDLWQLHSAQAESCDINKIVERFRDGDLTVLNRVQGTFADLSGLPRDLRGMSDLVHGLENDFNNLDPAIKSKFSSFEDWLSSAGSDEWFKVMSMRSESGAAPMNNAQQAEGES